MNVYSAKLAFAIDFQSQKIFSNGNYDWNNSIDMPSIVPSKISIYILEVNYIFLELCIGFYEEITPQAIFRVLGVKIGNF